MQGVITLVVVRLCTARPPTLDDQQHWPDIMTDKLLSVLRHRVLEYRPGGNLVSRHPTFSLAPPRISPDPSYSILGVDAYGSGL
jgi:hypothetical protein